MSHPKTGRKTSSFEACDQFFSIAELFNLFLEQCSPKVLLNCTLVCRDWKDIIEGSTLLQEHLFLRPIEAMEGVECKLNPLISLCFAPILGLQSLDEDQSSEAAIARFEAGNKCAPEDLTSMPWARNTSMYAPTRRAFARPEASWRNMLVSQPPLQRLDWWHEWTHDRSVVGNVGSWFTRRVFNRDGLAANGWGHQDQNGQDVTLDMLWDLVESRLTRGCSARVQFFPRGKAVEEDQHATVEERSYILSGNTDRRQYTPTEPRVKITTQQIWSKVPWSSAGFDMQAQQWVTMRKTRPSYYAGDGFNVLLADCFYDYQGSPRWSKSDGFCWTGLNGESSGS